MHYTIEFLSALLLFSGIVVVYNLRSVIENDNKVGYRYIITGLITMLLCSVVSVIGQQEFIQKYSFYRYSILLQLIYWIGMITGMTLLLSGVSNWLPVYQKNMKHNSQAYLKVELFKKIEQLIRFEHRNKVILFQSIEMILKHYNFIEVGYFVYSQKNKEMLFLGAVNDSTCSNMQSRLIHFHNAATAESISENNIKLIYSSETHLAEPDLMLPIIIEKKLLGAFSFYSDNTIEDETIVNLKLITDILAKKIIETSETLQADFISHELKWNEKVNQLFDTTKTVSGNISIIKDLLQSEMSIDYISVAFPYMKKYPKVSLSQKNQVLQDLTNTYTSRKDLGKYVIDMNLPVIIDNLNIETDFDVELSPLQSDMKSMLAFPVTNNHGTTGVLILASAKYRAYSEKNLHYCNQLNKCINSAIRNSIQQIEKKNDLARKNELKRLLKKSMSILPNISIYQMATDFLSYELQASFVRISSFDSDLRFLNSQALSVTEITEFITPKDATMMLMLMPNHQNVLKSRETIVINNIKSGNEISLNEQRQLYGTELSNYFIVPIFHESLIVGVISVGYVDNEFEINKRDINLVEDVSTILEVKLRLEKRMNALRHHARNSHSRKTEVNLKQLKDQPFEDSSRIKNILIDETIGI